MIECRMQLQLVARENFHCFMPINLFQVNAPVLSGDYVDFTTFNVLPEPFDVFDFFSFVNDYKVCINPDDMNWYATYVPD